MSRKLRLKITFFGCEPLPIHRQWYIGRNAFGKDEPLLDGQHVNFYRDTKDQTLYTEVAGQWYISSITSGEQV
jgi:hypothetical protein